MKEASIFLNSITRNMSSYLRSPPVSFDQILSASDTVIPKYIMFSFLDSRITDMNERRCGTKDNWMGVEL